MLNTTNESRNQNSDAAAWNPDVYLSLITHQSPLQQRTINVMQKMSSNHQKLASILENMQIIHPNEKEHATYSENCDNMENNLQEQQLILEKWVHDSKFTLV
jgi:hypothetical protein